MEKGTQALILDYETLTSETDEMVTGIIEELKDINEEYYIQIQSDSGTYSGSKIKLKNGKFLDNVVVEPNKSNLYWIYLFDNNGNQISINPDSFTIVHGLSVSGAPLPHSIGIVLAQKDIKNNFILSNVREVIFEKGSSLPLKHHGVYKTVRKLKKNDDNPINIFLDEGESTTPDRNTFICEVLIRGKDLPYDLPEETEIEISVELSESRQIFVTVYIPNIDLNIEECRTIEDEVVDVKKLENELVAQTEKSKNISQNCTADERRDIENTIQSVRASVENAHLNEDEKRKANKQLKDLKIVLDKIEKEKEMPQMIKEFQAEIENVQNIINEHADVKDRDVSNDQLLKIKNEGEKAVSENDKILLARVNEQIKELGAKAFFSNPNAWVFHFQKIISENHNFINEKEAKYYIEKGQRAIELDDVDELKRCVHNLMLLLPSNEQEAIKNNLSGITTL